MMTYAVEEDENYFTETDIKTHTLRIMRLLKTNKANFIRLNASYYRQIQKLQMILELMKKYVFVEETFSDKSAISKYEQQLRKQKPERFTTHDQLSVIISRSNDFGVAYNAAMKKAVKAKGKERENVGKDLNSKINELQKRHKNHKYSNNI